MAQEFDGPVTINGELIVTGALGAVLSVKNDPNVHPKCFLSVL
jgi:hypothetical protein